MVVLTADWLLMLCICIFLAPPSSSNTAAESSSRWSGNCRATYIEARQESDGVGERGAQHCHKERVMNLIHQSIL